MEHDGIVVVDADNFDTIDASLASTPPRPVGGNPSLIPGFVVSVLLNQGDGTFAAAVAYGAGVAPLSVAIGEPWTASTARILPSRTVSAPPSRCRASC